jgi:hypothetical protein
MVTSSDEITLEKVREWHKGHVAKLEVINEQYGIKELVWGKPNGSLLKQIRYRIWESHLYITGDYGDTTLRLTWNPVSFKSVADCSISYYLEKIKASDKHDGIVSWNIYKAKKYYNRLLNSDEEEILELFQEGKKGQSQLRLSDRYGYFDNPYDNEFAWNSFLIDVLDEHLAPDWGEDRELCAPGNEITTWVIIQYYGLKLAVEYLEKENK